MRCPQWQQFLHPKQPLPKGSYIVIGDPVWRSRERPLAHRDRRQGRSRRRTAALGGLAVTLLLACLQSIICGPPEPNVTRQTEGLPLAPALLSPSAHFTDRS